MKGTKPTFTFQSICNVSRTASAVVRALSISAKGVMMANVYFALVNIWERKYTHNSDLDNNIQVQDRKKEKSIVTHININNHNGKMSIPQN